MGLVGTGVAVGGGRVAVGGTGVRVAGIGVAVGGTAVVVAVAGTDVALGNGVAVAVGKAVAVGRATTVTVTVAGVVSTTTTFVSDDRSTTRFTVWAPLAGVTNGERSACTVTRLRMSSSCCRVPRSVTVVSVVVEVQCSPAWQFT